MTQKLLVWLDDSDFDEPALIGDKYHTLLTLNKLGFPLIPGFILTNDAYLGFVSHNNLFEKVHHIQGSISEEEKQKKALQKEYDNSFFPKETVAKLFTAYEKLSGKINHTPLMVSTPFKSASTIKGEANLLLEVKKLWCEAVAKGDKNLSILVQLALPVTASGTYSSDIQDTSLSVEESKLLEQLSQKAKQHFYFPQSLTFVKSGKKLFITNCKEYTPSLKETSTLHPNHTATKIYASWKEGDSAHALALKHVDGVGILESTTLLQKLPTSMSEEKTEKGEGLLQKRLHEISSVFSPRPVIYKLSSLEEQLFLELDTVKKLRGKAGDKNISLLIPAVHNSVSLQKIKTTIASFGLYRSPSFKLFLEIALPSQVIELDQFLTEEVDGVALNIPHLTNNMLGLASDERQVDEIDDSLLWAYKQTISRAHTYGIPSLAFVGSLSFHGLLLKHLVDFGISGVMVDSDAIELARDRVALFETEKLKS